MMSYRSGIEQQLVKRSKSNEKVHRNVNVSKPLFLKNKAVNKNSAEDRNEETRPGSCPLKYSSWEPSRDWHRYLSGAEPNKSCFPAVSADKQKYFTNVPGLRIEKKCDELIVINRPTHKLQNSEEEASKKNHKATDEFAKTRNIGHLVEELARCKQQNEEDADTIMKLKNKVDELKTSLKELKTNEPLNKMSASSITSTHRSENTGLQKQLTELNILLYQMQIEKSSAEVQMKTLTAQAEKMTRTIHSIHRENTELQVELRITKEKLSTAQQAVERMEKELNAVEQTGRADKINKACQIPEGKMLGTLNCKLDGNDAVRQVPEDNQLMSELFFNKSIRHTFSPTETIIFLPAGKK